MFPNVAVNILPKHVFLIHAQPVSPRATHETTYLLVHPEVIEHADLDVAVDQLAADGPLSHSTAVARHLHERHRSLI